MAASTLVDLSRLAWTRAIFRETIYTTLRRILISSKLSTDFARKWLRRLELTNDRRCARPTCFKWWGRSRSINGSLTTLTIWTHVATTGRFSSCFLAASHLRIDRSRIHTWRIWATITPATYHSRSIFVLVVTSADDCLGQHGLSKRLGAWRWWSLSWQWCSSKLVSSSLSSF